METIVRKVVPGHFSLVFSKWNIDGMAGTENNVREEQIYRCFAMGFSNQGNTEVISDE